jgi:hypothetical protein
MSSASVPEARRGRVARGLVSWSSAFVLVSCLPVLACGTADEDANEEDAQAATGVGEGSTTGGGTTAGITTGMPAGTTGMDGSGTTAARGGTSTGDPDGSAPPIGFDFPPLPDAPPIDESCGMVDFLFVIDDSGSMFAEQASLVANFPAFIDGIEATLETVDTIHVGVVTTDAYQHNIPECRQVGGLVVQTNMGACGPYEEGANYMTEMDALDIAFSCAATVGINGDSSERPMQAVVDAVTGVYGEQGECNEGFMREDALLVVVIITDEADIHSPGDPMTWHQAVVDAKLGIPENVVVVSLINVPGSTCHPFDPAQSIADFTTSFGVNGFMAEICLADFAPIFEQAVGIIDVACDNYIPPN